MCGTTANPDISCLVLRSECVCPAVYGVDNYHHVNLYDQLLTNQSEFVTRRSYVDGTRRKYHSSDGICLADCTLAEGCYRFVTLPAALPFLAGWTDDIRQFRRGGSLGKCVLPFQSQSVVAVKETFRSVTVVIRFTCSSWKEHQPVMLAIVHNNYMSTGILSHHCLIAKKYIRLNCCVFTSFA